MKSFASLMVATTVSAIEMSSQPVTQVSANLNNYFTQVLADKLHTCDFTMKRNKNPDQPTFESLQATVSAENPFVDADFPADITSLLWKDVGESWGTADQVEKWMRISDVYADGKEQGGGYSLFGENGVTPKDIFQGSIGNCWFMSAISAIAEKPGRVESLFLNPTDAIEPSGIYGINMKALGVPHTILVDDQLPGEDWYGWFYPKFAEIKGDKSVWAAILEKAYAKYHGNYKHTVGGWPQKAVWDLLGGPYEEYDHLTGAGGTVVTGIEDLWTKLTTHDVNDEIMITSTWGTNHFTQADNGIANGHAYTIIGVTDEVPGVRLVKLRNPWGSEKYKGPYCDDCKEWDSVSQDVKDSLQFASANDGVFYIPLEDYHAYFEETNIIFDISDGDWSEDHYLFLNDEDRKNSQYWSNKTRHEFSLTNTSDEVNKVYAQIHTWADRSYVNGHPDCYYKWNYLQWNFPNSYNSMQNFAGVHQTIYEMQPGEVLTGVVELSWEDDQAQDWSIVTYAKGGQVEIALTDMPDRPSDTTVGYYAGPSIAQE